MRESRLRALRIGLPAVAWALALALGTYALRHPSPLWVDLGAGDEAVASGFREGWSRYELRGKTTYRVTGSIATITLPLRAEGGDVTLELRLARFAERAAEITLAPLGRAPQTWSQHPVGWRLRRFALGAWEGRVALEIRASVDDAVPAGIALDWFALHGVSSVWPAAEAWLGLLALLIVAPALASLLLRSSTPLSYGSPLLLVALALWSTQDTVAVMTTVALAGPRVLVASGLALPLILRLGRRADAPARETTRAFLWAPALVIVVALIALSSPRYYYPDVDTHARFLAGMREHPGWALDPREYQEQTRAWTRRIGERFVGFPYSAAFHVLSWPLAPVLGEVGAVKTMAATAVAFSLLLVYRLARASGSAPGTAILAQSLFAIMPVVPSRLTLALLPSLLGQTMELGLLLAWTTRLSDLSGWRPRLAAFVILSAVQLSYTGSIYNVALLVLFWAGVEAFAARRRNAALWMLATYLLAALVVAVTQYGYFFPALLSDVLPHLDAPQATTAAPIEAVTLASVVGQALRRLWIFFLPIGIGLAAIGWSRLAARNQPVRRALFVALGAGVVLLFLRPAVPTLFSDAKEVELLAGPMAVAAALGTAWLWSRPRFGRIVAVAAAVALVAWSALRASELYASRLSAMLGG